MPKNKIFTAQNAGNDYDLNILRLRTYKIYLGRINLLNEIRLQKILPFPASLLMAVCFTSFRFSLWH